MPALPPRNSRVLQAADALKDEISRGGLSGMLPGERELAKRLRVSRITLQGALQILEHEQWVSPSEPRKRRSVLKPLEEVASERNLACEGKVVVTLSPLEMTELPGTVRLVHSRIHTHCADAGIKIKHRSLDVTHMKRPAHRLREFVLKNPGDVYLLLLSTREIQEWFSKSGLSSIVLGSGWPEFGLSSADWDQRALGVHTGAMLSRMGHVRVGMLYPTPAKYGMELFHEGLKSLGQGLDIRISRQDFDPDSILRGLIALVKDPATRPTVLILPRVFYVMVAATALPSMGIRIPEDVSLLCLVYDDSFRYFVPNVAGYKVPADLYARSIYKLIIDHLLHAGSVANRDALVMPEFVPAPSLGSRKL